MRAQHCQGRSRNGLRYSSRAKTLTKDCNSTPVLSQCLLLGQIRLTGTRRDKGTALGLTEERRPGGEAASHPSLCVPFTQHLDMFVRNLQLCAPGNCGAHTCRTVTGSRAHCKVEGMCDPLPWEWKSNDDDTQTLTYEPTVILQTIHSTAT